MSEENTTPAEAPVEAAPAAPVATAKAPAKKAPKPKKRISKNKNCSYTPELIDLILESIKTNPGLVKYEQLLQLADFFNQQVKLTETKSVATIRSDMDSLSSSDEAALKSADDELALGTPEEKLVVETFSKVSGEPSNAVEHFVFDDSKRRSIWSL